MNVREQIKNGVLLMDGSMGSYLSTITGQSSQDCELAVLEQRDIVKDIHQQYLEAGSQAILTNTYNANRVFCHGNDTLVVVPASETNYRMRPGYNYTFGIEIQFLRGRDPGRHAVYPGEYGGCLHHRHVCRSGRRILAGRLLLP